MDKETKTALLESIAHWERMRDDPCCHERPGIADCALCGLFSNLRCRGCPVAEKTENIRCRETPHSEADLAWRLAQYPTEETLSAWRAAAQAEIDFLKSLLPREEY